MKTALCILFCLGLQLHAAIPVTMKEFPPIDGVKAAAKDDELSVSWPAADQQRGSMVFDLREGTPLIKSLAVGDGSAVSGVDPLLTLTVGTRVAPSGRPPEMSQWNIFFDNPHKRPHETHVGALVKRSVTVSGEGNRMQVRVGELNCGSFKGECSFTFYAGSPFVLMEAVVSTEEDKRAYIFDLGLMGEKAGWQRLLWTDTDDKAQSVTVDESSADTTMKVRHRMLAAEGKSGSLAIFPPPHAFFFPVDITTNNGVLWRGRGHQGVERFGIGVRQDPRGGGNFVPWFNAPPGTRQRIGLFLLPHAGEGAAALAEARKYTRGDRFKPLPEMTTFTSHYHMAVAMTAMEQQKRGIDPLPVPEFVKVFKDMGVQSIHLGEFHGDGHPQDPGPLRLPEMKMMFSECARLSDENFLLMPGEEANQHLGIRFPGRHPGHWMLYFPKPVYWTMVRDKDQPLVENDPQFGQVYHVGSRDDMVDVIKRERGLAWTAHARIKASSWTPDIFREEDFYRDDLWLGAAWKAMPADLSRDRLGERCLDLLSDMSNWGDRKYLPGEVDVFKIDHTSELYGHMNINYLRLPKIPRYQDGWQPILDVLRTGAFFTTTGEVLINSFIVGGKQSGEVLKRPADGKIEIKASLEWTFPLQFVEIISGDGSKVYREHIDLTETKSFGAQSWSWTPNLAGRKWVRLEVWDIARNGAYTQPVWLEE
jgi:hypothetical protein